MKLTPEELKRLIKGIPMIYEEEKEDLSDIYGLDKDDCLGRKYPGVAERMTKKRRK